ncbi:MAG: HAD family hydrolase [Balneolaceae bacterium]
MRSSLTEDQTNKLRALIKKLCVSKAPIQTGVDPVLKKLERIKAVYFDVYGTILISGTEPMMRKDGKRELLHMTEAFSSFGLPIDEGTVIRAIELLHHSVAESHAIKKLQGIDFPEVDIISIWEQIVERLEAEEFIEEFEKTRVVELLTYFVIRYDDPWLMPHLEETIEELESMSLHLGIISNSQFYTPITLEALSGKTMEELGFEEEASFWSFSEDIAKPSVEFYRRAKEYLIERKNIHPNEVLFVGNDMLNDIYPAQKIGFKTALFAGDRRSFRLRSDDVRCQSLEPDITITDLNQLKECIG